MKTIAKYIYRYILETDKTLLLLCAVISTYSVVLLMGIAHSELAYDRQVLVQAGASILGICSAIVLSKIDYKILAKLWKLHTALAYFLVGLTFVMGFRVSDVVDDRAWLPLPFGMSLQPAEFLKISFIVTFALHLQKAHATLNQPKTLIPILCHAAVPVGLIMLQGDDGTALVFIFIVACMLFVAGLSWKYIIAAAGVMMVSLPALWYLWLDDDKRMRIMSVLNPALDPKNIGWQQTQGLISIGSGQMWGKGIFTGEHHYVPELYNDFIFAFIGEALGFVGCLSVLFLLSALIVKVLFTSFACSDFLGKLICVGVFAMFAFQILLNVGMCLSVLPVIGITLPFFSAGGTSVLASYLAIGLVLNVHIHNKKSLFAQ